MLAGTLVLTLLPSGCQSQEEEQPPPFSIQTPMEHDPLDVIELAPWWTDGSVLLHLATDGRYSLHVGTDRHAEPQERGRWVHASYAVLWLEPYQVLDATRRRISITRTAGMLVLEMPDGSLLTPMPEAPRSMEDRLFGLWTAPSGTLRLRSDMRYQLSASAGAGHEGRWSLRGELVVLEPATGRDADPLSLEHADDDIRLRLGDEVFERVVPPTSEPPPPSAGTSGIS
jgi:hypothetical protein